MDLVLSLLFLGLPLFFFFFFNDTATTEIYTLSLHDALPIRLAIAFASGSLAAPLTLISARKVAPSPSATIWPARLAQTACRPSAKALSAAAERVALPAPLASRTTVSFVEHSP